MRELLVATESDEATSNDLEIDLFTATSTEVLVQKSEGLDGVKTVITLMQIAGPILSAVLPILLTKVRARKVTKIRVGDVEIENPTEAQVEALWRRIETGPSGG